MQRGDIRLFVAFRPGENVTNEVSFTGGYPFQDGSTVSLAVGARELHPRPRQGDASEWAWTDPADDARAVAALRAAPTPRSPAPPRAAPTTDDTFSLMGFTAAVEDAEARCR